MSEQDDQIEPLQQSEPDSAFKKFKNLGRAPDLLTEELYAFDRIAYEVEVSQLIKKAVLRPVNEHDAVQRKKSLSTKMVRTWRCTRRGNQSYYLRQSRLVAREFRWLEEKQGLFSPSTTTNVVKLIPLLFLCGV